MPEDSGNMKRAHLYLETCGLALLLPGTQAFAMNADQMRVVVTAFDVEGDG